MKVRSPCALACLSEPRLSGMAPGLLLAGMAEADPKAFPCCDATGSKLLDDQEVTVSCALSARLKRVRRLLARPYDENHPADPRLAVPPTGVELAATLKRLAAIAKGEHNRGLAYVTRAAEETPRPPVTLTTVALMAAWRFGLSPHVVRLSRGPVADIYPVENPKVDGRRIILLEGNFHLWEPPLAEAVDALVGYAYRTLTPLFLSFQLPDPRALPQHASSGVSGGPQWARSAFRTKIAGVKNRTPLSWLAPDCLDKLPAVTDGLKGLFPTAARPRSPKASETAKLPWNQ